MNSSNQQTIESYNAHVQEYIDGTHHDVSGVLKEWLGAAIQDLPKTARILEFGSAFGRDAEYLKGLDYTVECTDATPAFVELLKQKGFNARKLNAITDDFGGTYDLILANAVLLHFTPQETQQVLQKVLAALAPNGTFAFTVKQGEGEKWTEDKLGAPRYFCFWSENTMRELCKKAGFSEIHISGDRESKTATWLQAIVRK